MEESPKQTTAVSGTAAVGQLQSVPRHNAAGACMRRGSAHTAPPGIESASRPLPNVALEDCGAVWEAAAPLWGGPLTRAVLVPEAKLHEQVDDEWSFVETQRHLLCACDAWLGNAVPGEEAPSPPLGFPAGGMPPEAAA